MRKPRKEDLPDERLLFREKDRLEVERNILLFLSIKLTKAVIALKEGTFEDKHDIIGESCEVFSKVKDFKRVVRKHGIEV